MRPANRKNAENMAIPQYQKHLTDGWRGRDKCPGLSLRTVFTAASGRSDYLDEVRKHNGSTTITE